VIGDLQDLLLPEDKRVLAVQSQLRQPNRAFDVPAVY
jgi:hypothetical protein